MKEIKANSNNINFKPIQNTNNNEKVAEEAKAIQINKQFNQISNVILKNYLCTPLKPAQPQIKLEKRAAGTVLSHLGLIYKKQSI